MAFQEQASRHEMVGSCSLTPLSVSGIDLMSEMEDSKHKEEGGEKKMKRAKFTDKGITDKAFLG